MVKYSLIIPELESAPNSLFGFKWVATEKYFIAVTDTVFTKFTKFSFFIIALVGSRRNRRRKFVAEILPLPFTLL